MKTLPKNQMSGMRELFIKLTLFCALMSCGAPVVKVEIVPMRIIGFAVYTAALQDFSEIRHDGVFATVYCSVHGGYAPYSDYKTEHPLETADETFAGYPIYTDGDTISVKMTEHRPADLKGVKALATIHAEVVFIGFCKQGTYRLNINGFEKTFRVGNIMPNGD